MSGNMLIMSNKVISKCSECERGGLESFIASVIYMFERYDEVVISSREGYMPAVDRIVSLLKNIGIEADDKQYTTMESKDSKENGPITIIQVMLRNPRKM